MSAPAIRMNRLNADLILLAAAAIWGLAFLFQKSAMAHVGPLTFIAARSALAAVALAPLAWREHARADRTIPHGLLPIACGGGLLFFVRGRASRAFPFGPWLALGGIVAIVLHESLIT